MIRAVIPGPLNSASLLVIKQNLIARRTVIKQKLYRMDRTVFSGIVHRPNSQRIFSVQCFIRYSKCCFPLKTAFLVTRLLRIRYCLLLFIPYKTILLEIIFFRREGIFNALVLIYFLPLVEIDLDTADTPPAMRVCLRILGNDSDHILRRRIRELIRIGTRNLHCRRIKIRPHHRESPP